MTISMKNHPPQIASHPRRYNGLKTLVFRGVSTCKYPLRTTGSPVANHYPKLFIKFGSHIE